MAEPFNYCPGCGEEFGDPPGASHNVHKCDNCGRVDVRHIPDITFGPATYSDHDDVDVDTPADAARFMRFLAEVNEQREELKAAEQYRDCAELLEEQVVDG